MNTFKDEHTKTSCFCSTKIICPLGETGLPFPLLRSFRMQLRTRVRNAKRRLGSALSLPASWYATIGVGLLWMATSSSLVTPLLAQSGAGAHPTPAPNPPQPLTRPLESTFDQARIKLESNSPKPVRQAGDENTCFLPPLNT